MDKLGIKYVHKTAHDTYKNGILKEQIHKILVNSKKIGEKIEELRVRQNSKILYHIFQFVKTVINYTQLNLLNILKMKKKSCTDVKILKLVLINIF